MGIDLSTYLCAAFYHISFISYRCLIPYLFRVDACTTATDNQPRAGYLHAGLPVHQKELYRCSPIPTALVVCSA